MEGYTEVASLPQGELSDTGLPLVTVLAPVYNEQRCLPVFLQSVIDGDYPHTSLEVLILDGGSRDDSVSIAQEYARRYPFIRVLHNPARIQAAALNLGIREARGQYIVRMDAHTVYETDYIRRCVLALETTDADNVGPVQQAVGATWLTRAIAIAKTSRFGVGDARFRYARDPQWTDTVYLGAWRTSTLRRLGGFDENWPVNEDYELNYRLRKQGGRILLDPTIRCRYFVRDSLRGLIRQYARYGFWKAGTVRAHPFSLRWRQLAPPTLAAGFAVAAGLTMLGLWPFALGLILPYLAAAVFAACWISAEKGWVYAPVLPVIFMAMHVSWGAGFWMGSVRFGPPRPFFQSVARAVWPPSRRRYGDDSMLRCSSQG